MKGKGIEKMIKIQERDDNFLRLLGKYGVLNNTTIKRIYGNKKRYHRYRKKLLEDEKYIVKNNKHAWLGVEGKRYLEFLGIEKIKQLNGSKDTKERLGKISEILVPLHGVYDCYPSWELKDMSSLGDRNLQFYGQIVNRYTKKGYYIYNVGGIRTRKYVDKGIRLKRLQIKRIKDEIVQNAQIGRLNRTIILVEDGLTMQVYKSGLESLDVAEQLLIPFNDSGIELLKELGNRNIKKEAIEYLYGKEYGMPNWKYADYTVEGDKQAIVLINNDGEKLIRIKQNQAINQFNFAKGNTLLVVCLEGQKKSFKKDLGEIEIKTVPNNFVYSS